MRRLLKFWPQKHFLDQKKNYDIALLRVEVLSYKIFKTN